MTRAQRVVFSVFSTMTLLTFFMMVRFEDSDPALIFQFGLRVSMAVSALALLVKRRENLLIAAAFFFTLFSDYYFVLVRTFPEITPWRNFYGIAGFIVAYSILTFAFSRGVKLRPLDLPAAAPFIISLGITSVVLLPHVPRHLLIPTLILGGVLSVYGWTSVATLYRGVYTKKAAAFIALASLLILISDIAMSFSMFHPSFQGYVLWIELLIWLTYIPAWMLYLVLMAGDDPAENET